MKNSIIVKWLTLFFFLWKNDLNVFGKEKWIKNNCNTIKMIPMVFNNTEKVRDRVNFSKIKLTNSAPNTFPVWSKFKWCIAGTQFQNAETNFATRFLSSSYYPNILSSSPSGNNVFFPPKMLSLLFFFVIFQNPEQFFRRTLGRRL